MGARLAGIVREFRARAEVTQEQLAERAGVSVRTIRSIESGRQRNPRLDSLRALAQALRLSQAECDRLVAAALGPNPAAVCRPRPPVLCASIGAGGETSSAVASAAWKAIYQELDNNALLALVPILAGEIDRGRRELERPENRPEQGGRVADAGAHRRRAMKLRIRRPGGTECAAGKGGFAGTSPGPRLRPVGGTSAPAMFAYLTELETRRRWILDEEARQRRLLPDPADFLPLTDQGTGT
uniref:helix-turn-helix transcriptional regulator n=1 Tax=Amycolatopsis sp. CA-096443 TaxID=3239919 RepID=UPI003F496CDD